MITIELTSHKVKSAACCIGYSSGLKCLDVSMLRSIKVLYEFILSKMTMALHLLKMERSEISDEGNLCSKHVMEKYMNIDEFAIWFCHSPSDGMCCECVMMPSHLLPGMILPSSSVTKAPPRSCKGLLSGMSTMYLSSSLLIPWLLCISALWPTAFSL